MIDESPNGFKAGNTNDTIKMLSNEDDPARPESLRGQEPYPYISCIDADMIVDKEYLRALMAHIYQDDKIGMVGLPQEFYNIPVNDPLYDNLTLQHQGDQIGRDKLDAAWCVGSGFVFPREAWHQVGGFQETSMCEDLIFGWALNGHGWKTAHVDERLQSGVQPENFVSHIKQRRRWYIGGHAELSMAQIWPQRAPQADELGPVVGCIQPDAQAFHSDHPQSTRTARQHRMPLDQLAIPQAYHQRTGSQQCCDCSLLLHGLHCPHSGC